MKVVTQIKEYRKMRQHMACPIGFVPTMGYLHRGHLELVRRARADNQTVVVSIFVNPAQFDPQEDLASYPRDTERDLALLEKEGTDVVLMPGAEEMYPEGFDSWVEVKKVAERLEGAFRPAFFRGVATVVSKLFNIVQPHRAYFGQKDAQQLIVIRKMVSDLNIDLEVVAVPTVRESDGLAMSSRNIYLDPNERQAAQVLWRALSLAQGLWSKGERSAERLRQEMTLLIDAEPLAKIDYVSVADPDTLEELFRIEGAALVSMAVRIGRTRLIDNVMLG